MGFNPSFKRPTCLATLKSCDTTKQSVCGWQYIYIYIYMHILAAFLHWYIFEHNRHFLSAYFFVNPFELPYWSFDIRRELVDKSSIINYFPSTFCLTLGHHQGRMYYKSDVTFVCTLLLRKKSVCTVILCSVYFSNLFL